MDMINMSRLNDIFSKVFTDTNKSYVNMTNNYHIKKIRDLVYHEIYELNDMDINFVNNPENTSLIENMLTKHYILFMAPHIKEIRNKIAYMDSIPLIEQRTPEWFEQRNNLLSASSIYKALGSESAKKEIVFEKIGIAKEFLQSAATIHGTVFEIVSQTLYESRNNISIKEYGCIPHKTHNFIGASPDGLVYNVNHIDMHNIDLDDENMVVDKRVRMEDIALFGRLLEIKNPKSRTISTNIPSHYEKQVITQEEVCDIPICDFLEMTYNKYENIDEFLEDIIHFNNIDDLTVKEQDNYIKNHNMPLCNISSSGVEKVILIEIVKPGGKYEGIMYDINKPYVKEEIESWISDLQSMVNDGIYVNIIPHFVNIKDYDIKTHIFKESDWTPIFNAARSIWSRILEERLLSDEDIKSKYQELMYSNEVNTANNSKKRKSSSKYELRNLMKKSKFEKVIYKFN